jgi:ADP-heptose:LPS heptosyltransferase
MQYRNVPITRVDSLNPDWLKYTGWACVVRYGGFGDVIQASSVLPGLRAQGYKVAFNCEDSGYNLLRENPYIDRFIVQAKGFIPMNQLAEYWHRLGQSFDKFVMLSGSIEGVLLSHPKANRDYFSSSHAERHAKMNRNYLEHIHDLAKVPHDFDMRFYSSASERRWAAREANKYRRGNRKLIMLSLSGSSVHKCYPYWDSVVAGLAKIGSVTVVTVGDYVCKILEHGWSKWPSVKLRSGEWSIRRTLAFAEECDVIVGPETGVLNAMEWDCVELERF